MNSKNQPGSIKCTVLTGLSIICILFGIFLAEFAEPAPIVLQQDTRMPNTQCANGLWGLDGCLPGYEYVPPAQFDYSLIIDDFENGNPLVRPDATPPLNLWQWDTLDYQSNTRPGSGDITNELSLFGDYSYKGISESGGESASSFQLVYYNNRNEGAVNHWRYLRDVISNWQTDTINRIRFWVKFPAGVSQSSPVAAANIQFGTYLRDAAEPVTNNESDNLHFYHYYNLKREGSMWHQVIVDSHPNHQRGNSGSLELDTIYYPLTDTDPGMNYFDMLTWFYVKEMVSGGMSGTTYFDGFEAYTDPNDEDIEQIYSLHGIYNDETGEIVVGWKRNKNTSTKSFDVKYAYSSFHENGGFNQHGTPAPNGTGILPYIDLEPNGYNGIEYRGVIDVTGRDYVYIAIKHQDSPTRFREIRIPVTTNGYPVIGGVQ